MAVCNDEISLQKPRWLDPDTITGLSNINYEIGNINRISDVSYEYFFTKYMRANRPCIISSSVTMNWKSRLEWVSTDGQPDFEFLERNFGSAVVPVSDCDSREYNSQCKEDMLFKDYLSYWQALKHNTKDQSRCLYLKDWHFQRTPLHADVYGSYSWSANICGRKRWLLFPPGQEECLKDDKKQLPYFLTDSDLLKLSVVYLDVIQEPEEIIFVPSGWYHQVINMEDTISINHNWFNSCNILYIWHCLYKTALDVENELSDCKLADDWEDQCQLVLRTLHGINYEDFLQILKFILEERFNHLTSHRKEDNWLQLYDVMSVKSVCSKIIQCKLSEKLHCIVNDLQHSVTEFLSEIEGEC
ncbi:2-oxoglutarate and iron-dependent oxygenase JMJD4-like isoform X2 [Argiope bruennichi]|uniref:2-oxoglutarate and iron-dependent oxygenase JMJD4-like isoform X2 n=1 Tax=Argiope bruennichi TaxID=94029 RepID=UPI002493FB1A|nr:2-oxoglutarate and iron-dependent oxygenase JMJD4-like isoform X2 [Argiope bruennichi]